MCKKYGAAFFKEGDGQYSVFLVDYNMATCGEDLLEAEKMAKELLELAIETEGNKNPKDIKKVSLEKLYFERTGEKLSDEGLKNACLKLV